MSPGIDDDTILRQTNNNGVLRLTLDNDFGELVFRQRLVHAGVMLIRLAGLQPSTKADFVATAIAEHETKPLNTFSVIIPGSIRIRKQQ